ncbi:glycerophosphodiester phosphodiesterase GDPD4 isoform X4 [Amborella trichopoda]|uniref:glycerophosphodiester phosphodiesterase GDPD4 isoform X4 n=1 Tax=Amborella trichopoda TaxID=13333 RepID=UPI0009BD9833|nr:glycerophosphodiester phosphodiesterase GDPD4 isoform X4 [Amborella trichopoda]|eukprot:XP_020518946.1 glycerophosphodiester phosphodiesterase GDPD4 isoform X4 [Amborella trichopoda]
MRRLRHFPPVRRNRGYSFRGFLRLLLILSFLGFLAPIYFHFRLRRTSQMRSRMCGWIENPPLVCAHGGDSSKAFPNTMEAYRIALDSQVDCIEIDVSRSLDGVLVALHDRDLQRLSGNATAKVGYFSMNEINNLDGAFTFSKKSQKHTVPMVEDALKVNKTQCINCVIWAKSDTLGRDVIRLSQDIMVGYIVMNDLSTGARTSLLRMRGAKIVGVYHPLINERLVTILHSAGKKVYAWTVDDEDSMRRMLFERVDNIITGHPSLLQQVMSNVKTQCQREGFSLD